MLILILIDVQYLQKVVFSFEKGLDGQNHSSSGPNHLMTPPPSKISICPHPLMLFGKPWHIAIAHTQQLVAYHLCIAEKEVILKWIPEELHIGGFQALRKYL